MKIFTNWISLVILSTNFLYSQNCAPNGITTNPAAPVNNQVPSKVNTFNWLNTAYGLNWVYDNTSAIISPFYQTDNAITNHFIDNKEMYPSDGWELIRRDFGFADNGSASNPASGNPYLVLYNKYTGILRVFVARGDQQPFNGVRLFMRFLSGSPMQTSLLSQTKKLVAIDQFNRDPIVDALSEFNNDYQRWFYADFNMLYDPCTCLYESKLHIGVYLVNSSIVSLEGTSNGELTSINNNLGSVNNQGRVWTLGNIADGANKVGSFYKTLDSYKTKEKANVDASSISTTEKTAKKSAIESLANAVNSSSFLRNGLGSIPFIGSAVSMLDFFIGGGKKSTGPTTVKVMPMTLNMSTRYEGTISALYRYKDIIFWNPGSNNINFDLNEYPYYNEVLGTLNLLRTAIVHRKITNEFYFPDPRNKAVRYRRTTYQYRVPDDIQYVINPASGLEIQDLKFALIVEGSLGGPAGAGFRYLESYDAESKKYQYRSDYLDIGCFSQRLFDIEASDEPGNINWHPGPNLYIKVMANLRRLNGDENTQNVLFLAKYPVTMQNSSDLGTLGPCRSVAPQTQAAVQSFCNSITYTGTARFFRYKENLEKILEDEKNKLKSSTSIEEDKFEVFPVPATERVTINYSITRVEYVKIVVTDLLGKNLITLADHKSVPGNFEIELFTNQFDAGIYLIQIERSSGKKIVKRLVIHK